LRADAVAIAHYDTILTPSNHEEKHLAVAPLKGFVVERFG
jgi:hypothetical protein